MAELIGLHERYTIRIECSTKTHIGRDNIQIFSSSLTVYVTAAELLDVAEAD
jgi:hypothetical protein